MDRTRKMSKQISQALLTPKRRERKITLPLANSSRAKHRRWPLVLRFTKGSVHLSIIFPVVGHALFTVLVVCLNHYISAEISLPSAVIPSLSIVVGLMLVFRNQTAFSRMWDGRMHLNTVTTSIRCLARQILANSPAPPSVPRKVAQSFSNAQSPFLSPLLEGIHDPAATATPSNSGRKNKTDEQRRHEEERDAHYVEETVKILIAILYSIKNHLRAEWGIQMSQDVGLTPMVQMLSHESPSMSYDHFLPAGLIGYEDRGLSLTLQLTVFVETFITHGAKKDWFHNAAASAMLTSLNSLTSSYGTMETIRLTPFPVAHLIHHRQTLALFCLLLPFAIVAEIGWWAVPLVSFVAFTLYGIEGIAQRFEDPFQKAKGDVDLDNVAEDIRAEVECLLNVWKESRQGRKESGPSDDLDQRRGWMFRPRGENLAGSREREGSGLRASLGDFVVPQITAEMFDQNARGEDV